MYLADYTLRKGKNWSIFRSIGLHIQVDIKPWKMKYHGSPVRVEAFGGQVIAAFLTSVWLAVAPLGQLTYPVVIFLALKY